MRVAIIGLGVIGQAQTRLFAGHEMVLYDMKDPGSYPFEAVEACDFAVICVGTPPAPDGSANLRHVTHAIWQLPLTVPVMIRSTVTPGTTDMHLNFRGGLMCHVPEFMGENPAHPWQDSAEVPYLLLGGDVRAHEFFRPILRAVFPGTIHECRAVESELAKYAANLYWATRVTFVNEMALICKQFGADYENVREAWLMDPRMTPDYTEREGHPPGFGGRCWPKDLSALIEASIERGYDPEFLVAVQDANARFRA